MVRHLAKFSLVASAAVLVLAASNLFVGAAVAQTIHVCQSKNGALRLVDFGIPGVGCKGSDVDLGEIAMQGPVDGLQTSVGDLQTQLDKLAFLAFYDASAFVFVTSTAYNGDFGGVVGADAICNNHAQAAGLPAKYKAWLATTEADDPESTFDRARGPYWSAPIEWSSMNVSA